MGNLYTYDCPVIVMASTLGLTGMIDYSHEWEMFGSELWLYGSTESSKSRSESSSTTSTMASVHSINANGDFVHSNEGESSMTFSCDAGSAAQSSERTKIE